MKEKAEKELAQCSAEMKELERQVAHDQRLKDFMSTKSTERSNLEDSLSYRYGESSGYITTLVKDRGTGSEKLSRSSISS